MALPEEELVEFLKQNLSIELDHVVEFGPVHTIRVKLLLGDTEISEASCTLPEQVRNYYD